MESLCLKNLAPTLQKKSCDVALNLAKPRVDYGQILQLCEETPTMYVLQAQIKGCRFDGEPHPLTTPRRRTYHLGRFLKVDTTPQPLDAKPVCRYKFEHGEFSVELPQCI